MEISEVKIFLKEGQDKKLKAYATLTFDNMFVVRNVKVIEGTKGLFVAMPSRKLKDPCPKCNFRNAVRSKFCNQCGASLPVTEHKPAPAAGDDAARQSEHKDIAHPITTECRDYIQKKVLEAYEIDRKAGPSPAPSASPSSAPTASSSPRPAAKTTSMVDEDNDIEL